MKLVNKFGGVKVAIMAFLAGGVLAAVPASYGTYVVYDKFVKASKVKSLEKLNEQQKETIRIQNRNYKDALDIIERREKEIKKINELNQEYLSMNLLLVQSRAPRIETIREVSNEVKKSVSDADICAITRINDKLRIYGNGSDFNPASLSSYGKGN
jgi:methionine synthase II (cobalamin-independent)